jgi:hypothetical protein
VGPAGGMRPGKPGKSSSAVHAQLELEKPGPAWLVFVPLFWPLPLDTLKGSLEQGKLKPPS